VNQRKDNIKDRDLPFVSNSLDRCHLAGYNSSMVDNHGQDLARIVKQQRLSIPLTLRELGARSGVSSSHLGRIEQGERFPSARILRKIARPLGFDENEMFMLAGYLSNRYYTEDDSKVSSYRHKGLDPYVARVLAQEPVAVQRAVIGILSMLRSLAKSTGEK